MRRPRSPASDAAAVEPRALAAPEDQEQLGEYLRTALEHCFDQLGYGAPLIVVCISVNGSVLVVRTDGDQVEELASQTEPAGYTLPLNIFVTDARGEATRMLVTNEGMSALN